MRVVCGVAVTDSVRTAVGVVATDGDGGIEPADRRVVDCGGGVGMGVGCRVTVTIIVVVIVALICGEATVTVVVDTDGDGEIAFVD